MLMTPIQTLYDRAARTPNDTAFIVSAERWTYKRFAEEVHRVAHGLAARNIPSLLTMATADRIIDDALVHELCTSMMQEAAQIGAAIGISDIPPVENMIDKVRSLGAFKMSMLQDVEHHKTVEIDALLTVIHEIGSLVGVTTPFVDAVLGLARLRASSLGLLDSDAAGDSDLSSPIRPVRSSGADTLASAHISRGGSRSRRSTLDWS
jgi:hypothetical protein